MTFTAIQPYKIEATTTASNASLIDFTSDAFTGTQDTQVRITSEAGSTAAVKFGGSSVEADNSFAASGNIPILGGSSEIFSVSKANNYVSVQMVSGTGNVYITTGFGE